MEENGWVTVGAGGEMMGEHMHLPSLLAQRAKRSRHRTRADVAKR
jgi:hypothetical protein